MDNYQDIENDQNFDFDDNSLGDNDSNFDFDENSLTNNDNNLPNYDNNLPKNDNRLEEEHKMTQNGIQCKFCNAHLQSKGTLNRHIAKVHGMDVDTCRSHCFCGKPFKTRDLLKLHMKAEHDLDENQCHICRIHFHYANSVRSHIMQVHERIKPFKCNICDYKE